MAWSIRGSLRVSLGAAAAWLALAAGPLASAYAANMTMEASVEASYPEGPVAIGGQLYLAEMTTDRVVRADTKGLTPIWVEQGCGPTSLSPLREGRALVLCHLGGYLAVVDLAEARTVDRVHTDIEGNAIGSPNDSMADDQGGVFLSDSGPFAPGAPAQGALLYFAADHTVQRLVTGIRYANGVAVDAERRLVYLSEHFGRRVLAFPITGSGQVGAPGVTLDRHQLEEALNQAGAPLGSYVGPDGIEPLGDGSILVAIYGAGAVVEIDSGGSVTSVTKVGPRFSTNVARWNELFVVTGAFSNAVYPYTGAVEFYRRNP